LTYYWRPRAKNKKSQALFGFLFKKRKKGKKGKKVPRGTILAK
jgi:hypothetical protein